jgi:hypothetical protein
MSRAVRAAVPEGASALCGWWSSITSTDLGPGGQPAADLPQPFVVKAGCADDSVNAVLDEELQVVHHHVGMGEVDDDLGVAVRQQTQRIARIDLG